MRFLVDECTGPAVASWLRDQNHDVFSVFDEARGMDDDGLITKAFDENRILITNARASETKSIEMAAFIRV
jgi:predicted nuclease of predicted toxin-antitoxin system